MENPPTNLLKKPSPSHHRAFLCPPPTSVPLCVLLPLCISVPPLPPCVFLCPPSPPACFYVLHPPIYFFSVLPLCVVPFIILLLLYYTMRFYLTQPHLTILHNVILFVFFNEDVP